MQADHIYRRRGFLCFNIQIIRTTIFLSGFIMYFFLALPSIVFIIEMSRVHFQFPSVWHACCIQQKMSLVLAKTLIFLMKIKLVSKNIRIFEFFKKKFLKYCRYFNILLQKSNHNCGWIFDLRDTDTKRESLKVD